MGKICMINKFKCPLPEESPKNKRFSCACGYFTFPKFYFTFLGGKEERDQTPSINFSPVFFIDISLAYDFFPWFTFLFFFFCFTDLGVPAFYATGDVWLKDSIFISELTMA